MGQLRAAFHHLKAPPRWTYGGFAFRAPLRVLSVGVAYATPQELLQMAETAKVLLVRTNICQLSEAWLKPFLEEGGVEGGDMVKALATGKCVGLEFGGAGCAEALRWGPNRSSGPRRRSSTDWCVDPIISSMNSLPLPGWRTRSCVKQSNARKAPPDAVTHPDLAGSRVAPLLGRPGTNRVV